MQPPVRDRSGKHSKLVVAPAVAATALPTQRCLLVIAAFLCSVIGTLAQEPTPTPQAVVPVGTTTEEIILPTDQVTSERIIVTGSNIPTAEEVGPNPVDTYSKDNIERLGVRSATDLVQKLPEVTGPSINENVNTLGNGQTEIDLRGLGPKETLVLQDGRRLAPNGFVDYTVDMHSFFGGTVDLNMFPIGLIDHIDVLEDGASAVYGNDAVAGVFNVWLIHKFRGVEVYTSYGNTNLGASNDQAEDLVYVLAGTGDDKTDIVVYAEWYNRAAIYSRDRNVSSNADFTRLGGTDDRSDDFAGRVGDFVYQPQLNSGVRTPTPHAFSNAGSDPQYVPRLSLPLGQQLFNYNALTPAMAPVDREYLYGSLDRKIYGQYLELFADFKYVRGFWDGASAPAPFTPDVFTDATHPFGISSEGISVPIQNPFNPFTVPDYTSPGGFDPKRPDTKISAAPSGTGFTESVHYTSLEAGLVTDKITTHNYAFTGGLKGNLGEFGDYFKTWDWESGFRYSEDDRTERLDGIVNTNALRAALLDTNPATAFNPFGINQNSPAVIDKVFVTTHRLGKASLILEDLKLNGSFWDLPAGPISFALGGEHRTEHATDQPDALTASGQTIGTPQATPDILPTKGSRDVWSLYWEVRVPVTSPTWDVPGLHSLELSYQERYDSYSDFGSTEKPKLLLRWQPLDSSLTLRGTYSEAYHAPTIYELYTSQAQRAVLVDDPASLTPSGTAINQVIGGNPNLQPETAYEWTYGVVWTPAKWIEGLTLSANFYHIDLRNVIVNRDPNTILADNWGGRTGILPNGAPTGGPFPDLIQRDPVSGAVLSVNSGLQNESRTITEGLDYGASYQLDTSIFSHGDFGTFTFTFDGNYLARYVGQPTPESSKISIDNRFIGPRLGSLPQNRWYASLFYDLGGLDAGATVHYVGQYRDSDLLSVSRKVREWTTLDLVVNYEFGLPQPATTEQVRGYVKDTGNNAGPKNRDMPVSTAGYNSRAWLNNTTITVGMNNVFDQDPPFVAGYVENGYDEWQANIRGRVWYVSLKKRF